MGETTEYEIYFNQGNDKVVNSFDRTIFCAWENQIGALHFALIIKLIRSLAVGSFRSSQFINCTLFCPTTFIYFNICFCYLPHVNKIDHKIILYPRIKKTCTFFQFELQLPSRYLIRMKDFNKKEFNGYITYLAYMVLARR